MNLLKNKENIFEKIENDEKFETDEEIFLKVLENSEYFGEIVNRYEKKLDRYLSRISALEFDERKDLLQEIFISAYEKIYSFEKDEKFSPWIYRIAHNKSIDYWRKNKKREKEISIDDNLSFVESKYWKNDSEIEFENMENKELLKKVYSKLSLKYKEIFVLRFEEEKTYEEISEILRIPKSSVGTLISRATKKMKAEYEEIINKNNK